MVALLQPEYAYRSDPGYTVGKVATLKASAIVVAPAIYHAWRDQSSIRQAKQNGFRGEGIEVATAPQTSRIAGFNAVTPPFISLPSTSLAT